VVPETHNHTVVIRFKQGSDGHRSPNL